MSDFSGLNWPDVPKTRLSGRRISSEMCDMSRMEDLGDLGRYRACFGGGWDGPQASDSGFKEEEGGQCECASQISNVGDKEGCLNPCMPSSFSSSNLVLSPRVLFLHYPAGSSRASTGTLNPALSRSPDPQLEHFPSRPPEVYLT